MCLFLPLQSMGFCELYTINLKELSQILLMRTFSRENMHLQLLAQLRREYAEREEFYDDDELQQVGLQAFGVCVGGEYLYEWCLASIVERLRGVGHRDGEDTRVCVWVGVSLLVEMHVV